MDLDPPLPLPGAARLLDPEEERDLADMDSVDDQEKREDPERWVRCATCEHLVARQVDRFAKDGRLDHVFTNPHGLTFQLGCWRNAPGCAAFGAESDEWAWFVGWTWQVAVCRACGTHLGWFFRQDDDLFAGLILTRLTFDT